MMWSASDETLLAGLGSGDPEAAAAFVRRYQRRLFGLALTILGDRQVAEEAAQEALVRAWQHAGAYDPRRGTVATWLLSIGRNVAIDMARLRRPIPVDPESDPGLRAAVDDDDSRWTAADETLRLRRALGALPEEQRRALVLASFYGRSTREISEIENAPIGTIKTRIRAAMMKLRSALAVRDE